MGMRYDIIIIILSTCIKYGLSYHATGIPIDRFMSSLPRRLRIHTLRNEYIGTSDYCYCIFFFTLVSYSMSKRNLFFGGSVISLYGQRTSAWVVVVIDRYAARWIQIHEEKKRSFHTCCSRMSSHRVPVVPRVGAVRKCAVAGAAINNAAADFSGARETTATTMTRVLLVTLRSHHSRRLHGTTL